MAMELDKELGDNAGLNAAIRSAKKAAKPGKIGKTLSKESTRPMHGRKSKAGSHGTGTFEARSEGIRAKKGDSVGGMGKRKNGK